MEEEHDPETELEDDDPGKIKVTPHSAGLDDDPGHIRVKKQPEIVA